MACVVASAIGSHGRQMRPPVPLVIIDFKKRAKGAVVLVVVAGSLVGLLIGYLNLKVTLE